MTSSSIAWKAAWSRKKFVTPISRSRKSASTSAGAWGRYLAYSSTDSICWTAMRRSMRRLIVLGLYWEKSCPVWARRITKMRLLALPASPVSVSGVSAGRECRPKACVA